MENHDTPVDDDDIFGTNPLVRRVEALVDEHRQELTIIGWFVAALCLFVSLKLHPPHFRYPAESLEEAYQTLLLVGGSVISLCNTIMGRYINAAANVYAVGAMTLCIYWFAGRESGVVALVSVIPFAAVYAMLMVFAVSTVYYAIKGR